MTNDVYMLWSCFKVKVEVVAALEAANDIVVPWLSELEEALYEDGKVSKPIFFLGSLIFKSITSEIKPGFVILLSLTSISAVSILTTEDMVGRCLGVSWVQRRAIFKYLQASSALNPPFSDMSTNCTNSFRSYSSHVCKNRSLNKRSS